MIAQQFRRAAYLTLKNLFSSAQASGAAIYVSMSAQDFQQNYLPQWATGTFMTMKQIDIHLGQQAEKAFPVENQACKVNN